jgi:hypothetical protein
MHMLPNPTPDYDPSAGARVYNEAAFRQFLAADWARAERLRRCVFLILVSMRHESPRRTTLPRAAAASVFLGLNASVRDVDFVGWFRQGRVPGALLVQGPDRFDVSEVPEIGASVRLAIEQRLPSRFTGALRVRVRRLGTSSPS